MEDIKVIAARVITKNDKDKVILKFNIKSHIQTIPNLTSTFETEPGIGIEYIREVFNLEPIVIDRVKEDKKVWY